MKVAVIPARGGSKRIPRKNIREFAGKPMIAHSINCALQSGLFERVIVSTDDEEIVEVAKKYGAEVPFLRPKELSGDHIGTTEVVAHAIEYLRNQGAKLSRSVASTQAPFIRQETSRKLSILEAGDWKYVLRRQFCFPIFGRFENAGGGWKCSSLNISIPARRTSPKPCTMPGSFTGDGPRSGSTMSEFLTKRRQP